MTSAHYYEPTEQDLRDWHLHCLAMAAEEMEEREEYFGPSDEHWQEADDYRNEENDLPDNEVGCNNRNRREHPSRPACEERL